MRVCARIYKGFGKKSTCLHLCGFMTPVGVWKELPSPSLARLRFSPFSLALLEKKSWQPTHIPVVAFGWTFLSDSNMPETARRGASAATPKTVTEPAKWRPWSLFFFSGLWVLKSDRPLDHSLPHPRRVHVDQSCCSSAAFASCGLAGCAS